MDTDHLVRSLECEPAIMRTPIELELMRRCYDLADELAEAKGEIEGLEKKADGLDKYSEFEIDPDDCRLMHEAHGATWLEISKMLTVLQNEGIDDVETLTQRLGLDD
jgi:hypothetical protein